MFFFPSLYTSISLSLYLSLSLHVYVCAAHFTRQRLESTSPPLLAFESFVDRRRSARDASCPVRRARSASTDTHATSSSCSRSQVNRNRRARRFFFLHSSRRKTAADRDDETLTRNETPLEITQRGAGGEP